MFFFSSRRRHTRSLCDWSSDVCSSDLVSPGITSAALFAFLLSFNEYSRAYFLVGGQDTLPIYMFGAMNAGTSPTIYALAGTILIVSFLGIGAALLALNVRQRRAA